MNKSTMKDNLQQKTKIKLKNSLETQPSKAKIQELKWKLTINRPSLPTPLNEEIELFGGHQLISKNDIKTRRKSESDLDLNIDNFNVNTLEKEISEYSKRHKTKKKCKKQNCTRHSHENSKQHNSKRTVQSYDSKHKHNGFDKNENSTKAKKTKSSSSSENRNNSSEIEIKNQTNEDSNELREQPKIPKNAFLIMMQARNNVIGSNLDGKDKTETEENGQDEVEIKSKLKTRKNFLEQWADSKGAKKRKLKEETREEYVLTTLNRRAKRLKRLFDNHSKNKSETQSEDENSICDENKKVRIKVKVPIKRKNLTDTNGEQSNSVYNQTSEKPPKTDSEHKKIKNRLEKKGSKVGGDENSLDISKENSKNIKSLIKRRHRSNNSGKIESNNDNSTDFLEVDSKSDKIKKESKSDRKKLEDRKMAENTSKNSRESETDTPKDSLERDSVNSYRNLRKKVRINYEEIEKNSFELSNGHSDSSKNVKKSVKLAPLFLKSKVKADPAQILAKENFLKSGMPEECLKLVEKHKAFDNCFIYETFPTVSHVFQNCLEDAYISLITKNCKPSKLLPTDSIRLDLIEKCTTKINLGSFTKVLKNETKKNSSNLSFNVDKDNAKQIVREIKKTNPEFPVKTTYRILKNKHSETTYSMWSEKYRPNSSAEIIGNTNSVNELKQWLQNWLTRKRTKLVNKKPNYDTDFEDSDEDSRSSTITSNQFNNTIVLLGPCGTGKTSSVYAVANELNFNILEINASSQRNGKKILNDIHEATQSRHFRENTSNLVRIVSEDSKYSLILIEDVNIVFSTVDEGFLNAVNSIITSGKRPVILTSSSANSSVTQKFVGQYKTLRFHSLSTQMLTPWLQLVSVVEGFWPKTENITQLLNFNRGDMRRTLLNLQFVIESANGSFSDDLPNKKNHASKKNVTKKTPPLEKSMNPVAESLINNFIETNLSLTDETVSMSYPINLTDLYRNLTNFFEQDNSNKTSLEDVSSMYECLTLTDIAYTKCRYDVFNKPCKSIWQSEYTNLYDSLTTDANLDTYSSSKMLVFDWIYCLNTKFTDFREFNFDSEHKSKLKNNLSSIYDKLLDGISISAYLSPKNLDLDYLPILRMLNRSEQNRELTNNKRGNRFCNYLKSLNIHCTNSQMQLLSNILINSKSDIE